MSNQLDLQGRIRRSGVEARREKLLPPDCARVVLFTTAFLPLAPVSHPEVNTITSRARWEGRGWLAGWSLIAVTTSGSGELSATCPRAVRRNSPAGQGRAGRRMLLRAYVGMLARGAGPDAHMIPSLLREAPAAAVGDAVHAHAVKFGLELVAHVASSLVLMYACRGDGAAARALLGACPAGGAGTPVVWNALISGHRRTGRFRLSSHAFVDMARAGVAATPVTYVSVLSACGKGDDVLLGMQVHKLVVESGALPDLKVENALVDMYAECGDMDAARHLFEEMQLKNMVSWTSMVSGFVKLGQVDHARALFDQMPERDTISWTAMIDGYVQVGRFKKALKTFREMQHSKVRADEFTMVSVVTACAQLGALETGEWARIYMKRHGIKMDIFVENALIDMYSKCGSIDRALDLFNEMRIRDKFTWTAVILGLAVNGHGEEAINMFYRMLSVFEAPDEVTFIGVLTACTHSGLVDKGRDFFLSMTRTYRIAPNVMHYGCIIDLLGRAGKVTEAFETIGKMPMRPNFAIWGTLLSACRVHGNSEIGEVAAERLLELDPTNSVAYILLSNMYAKSNRWEDVRQLRRAIMEKGINKEPGCSLIEIGGTIHEFVAGDRSHPMSKEIYSKLEKVLTDIKNAGYTPDVTEVIVQVTEEEKHNVLYWHSEKLAVAFALLSSESNVTIRIVKNLRMCLDCHNALKVVSKLYGRKIVVRDRTRFHHFTNGFCSCMDYW